MYPHLVVHQAKKKAKLSHLRYIDLDGEVSPLNATFPMFKAASKRKDIRLHEDEEVVQTPGVHISLEGDRKRGRKSVP